MPVGQEVLGDSEAGGKAPSIRAAVSDWGRVEQKRQFRVGGPARSLLNWVVSRSQPDQKQFQADPVSVLLLTPTPFSPAAPVSGGFHVIITDAEILRNTEGQWMGVASVEDRPPASFPAAAFVQKCVSDPSAVRPGQGRARGTPSSTETRSHPGPWPGQLRGRKDEPVMLSAWGRSVLAQGQPV